MDAKSFIAGICLGAIFIGIILHGYNEYERRKVIAIASALFGKKIPANAVIVKGEKGKNGGGDGGDGLFWDSGLAIMPGAPAAGAKK